MLQKIYHLLYQQIRYFMSGCEQNQKPILLFEIFRSEILLSPLMSIESHIIVKLLS